MLQTFTNYKQFNGGRIRIQIRIYFLTLYESDDPA